MSRDKLIDRYWADVKRITDGLGGTDKYPITSDNAPELPAAYREAVQELQAARCSGGSLSHCQVLCDRLGNPQERYKVVHVAGTNGKGSVCHKIVYDLVSHGIAPVGEMTSPHLLSIRERMKVNGVPISVCEFIALHDLLKEVGSGGYRWFSGITAICFFYFAAKGVEVAVLETGIGGRLDATNIVTQPLVTVVTSIGHDHPQILGGDLELIAKEKAGIFKPGVPAVIGPNAIPKKVFEEQALIKNVSEIVFVPTEISFEPADRENARVARAAASIALERLGMSQLALPLVASVPAGREQYLTADEVSQATVAVVGGRFPPPPLILIDVGHNVTAIRRVCQSLKLTLETKQSCSKVVFCLTLSINRNIAIFDPIVETFNDSAKLSATLYILPVNHIRCRKTGELVEEIHNQPSLAGERLKETEEVWSKSDLNCVIAAAFREACSSMAGLAFLGSFFSVEDVARILTLSSVPSRRQSLN